jgi:diguanylate cyclase (GGDEF)-like protein
MSCGAIVALAVIVINRYHRTLMRAATRDHVTGAHNRQSFEGMAGDAIVAARRAGQPLALLLFDLDDFKRYNDTYGHNAGDAALREVARVATEVVRRSDVVGRWGGDEFVLLLPGCDERAATRIAGDVASAVRADDPHEAGMPAGISISTGVAALRATDRLADLVARADHAMYHSRRAVRATSQRTARQIP